MHKPPIPSAQFKASLQVGAEAWNPALDILKAKYCIYKGNPLYIRSGQFIKEIPL